MNFRFSFEELSLLSQDGFNLRLEANGYAVIEFNEDGYWFVSEICLEATRLSKHKYGYDRKHIEIFGAWEREKIKTALVSNYCQDIQDRIRDELNEHGISIPDPNREHLEVSTS